MEFPVDDLGDEVVRHAEEILVCRRPPAAIGLRHRARIARPAGANAGGWNRSVEGGVSGSPFHLAGARAHSTRSGGITANPMTLLVGTASVRRRSRREHRGPWRYLPSMAPLMPKRSVMSAASGSARSSNRIKSNWLLAAGAIAAGAGLVVYRDVFLRKAREIGLR